MAGFTYQASDETATARLGAALAELLPGGTTVALCGTLGAGKTRLVQEIAAALGVNRRDVVSPTFVLVHEYQGRRPIYHLDAYRLRDTDEFMELGPDEFFDSPGLTFVEWADRVESCLPADRIEITIELTGDNSREFHLTALGNRYAELIEQLHTALG